MVYDVDELARSKEIEAGILYNLATRHDQEMGESDWIDDSSATSTNEYALSIAASWHTRATDVRVTNSRLLCRKIDFIGCTDTLYTTEIS